MSTAPVSTPGYTIYHSARCSNSRGALALLREHGIEPEIVDYIARPLDAAQLKALVTRLQVPVRELLRSKEAAYAELGLRDAARSDDELMAAVAAHPELLNRPIVVTPRGALLCRPPERVLQLLPGAAGDGA
ncbi:arsenate reductase [Oryzisolibacter propanilivorax]|uniref:Arsenate reductase n=1 Tax=Oryzisolibacter propanilivorax TaxID=1527607 RepID=A0A1G9UYZ8_9BURK|nr:arsenate reductase (glutaredoxin) [Oryzisolibacter propanilivorax]SDM64875.1 arsenate reductase [Oryzisolibacter propanilivorax]